MSMFNDISCHLLSRGALKSKGKGKLSIHYFADLETMKTVFRTIRRTNWKVITTRQIEQILYGCRIPNHSWSRTVFHDERHWRILTNHRFSGMSWVHLAKRRRYIWTERLDQREYQKWTRIGSYNLLPAKKIWSGNQNWVCEQRQFSLVGQNFSWLEQVSHEHEQQRAGNLRNAVRRICVKIECKCFCKPIKGQSKTTKTYFCQLIHKNCTYWWGDLDWCWTRKTFALRFSSVEEIDPSSSTW